jgi:CheY-like chemotaxis protein
MYAVTTCATESEPITVPQGANAGQAPILVVDDSKVSQILAGKLIQHGTGQPVIYAQNGREALLFLDRIEPCLVLTDLCMPEMNGFELVEAIRANYPRIPVILMTAYGSEAIATRALKAGAASYVRKKDLAKDLVTTVEQILKVVEGDLRRRQALACQTARTSSFELASNPDLIAPLISVIQEELVSFAIGDETARIRVGVALQESLANALFHGNLECSTDLRQEDERIFYNLAAQRQMAEPYRSRRIHVVSKVDRDEARIVIRDEGPGFDVSSLNKPFDPDDLMRIGGRGMILIRTFLDEVFHNETGNQITLVKRK